MLNILYQDTVLVFFTYNKHVINHLYQQLGILVQLCVVDKHTLLVQGFTRYYYTNLVIVSMQPSALLMTRNDMSRREPIVS